MNGIKRYLNKFIFILGIGFMIYGLYRGEVQTVFQKAINICLECIGIG